MFTIVALSIICIMGPEQAATFVKYKPNVYKNQIWTPANLTFFKSELRFLSRV